MGKPSPTPMVQTQGKWFVYVHILWIQKISDFYPLCPAVAKVDTGAPITVKL